MNRCFKDMPVFDKWINIFIFLSGALILTFKSGYMVGLIGLSLMGLADLWRKRGQSISSAQKKVIYLFLIYFIFQCLFVFHDVIFKLNKISLPSRVISGILIYLVVCRNNVSFKALVNGVATGAILGGVIAIHEKIFLHWDRAFANIMPIQAGDTCMSLGLISLCFLFYFIKKNQKKYITVFMIASVMGILGSLLSGSRGGWILLPLNIIAILRMNREVLPANTMKVISGAVIAALVLFLTPATGIQQRVDQAFQDLHRVTDKQWQGTDGSNSLGIRLMLWRSNWESFTEKPLLGWGETGIDRSYQKQYQEGKITQFISDYGMASHAHNQFLDEMAKKGIIGLLVFLAILVIPGRLLLKNNRVNHKVHVISGAGIILIFSVIDYSLSQAFFNHNSGMTYYVLSLSILLGYFHNSGIRSTQRPEPLTDTAATS